MKYIAVFHKWFVNSRGFEKRELKSTSYKNAYNEAVLLHHNEIGTDHSAFTIIEIANNKRSSKLTFKERLLGKIMEQTISKHEVEK